MATKKTAPVFKADAMYEVQLARPVKVGRTTFRPTERDRLKGKVVETIMADVLDAQEIKQ